MLSAVINHIPRQELVSQAMKRTIVSCVTPESDLVQEEIMTTQTRVEIFPRQRKQAHQNHGLHLGSVVKNPELSNEH